MTNSRKGTAAAASGKSNAQYSANVHSKARASTSCSFCWFVISLYPSFQGMVPRDDITFRAHLVKAHGLRGDIEP